jgi:hypothetical protein
MIAFKTYSQCPAEQRPANIPLDWPWTEEIILSEQINEFLTSGYQVLEDSAYAAYKQARQSEYNTWYASTNPVAKAVEDKIKSFQMAATNLLIELYVANTMAGITTAQSDQMFDDYSDVLNRIREGAFPTALYRLNQKAPSGFVTQTLIDTWKAKIQAYLS